MIPLGFFGGQAGIFNTWSRTSIPASMVQNGAIYTSLTNGNYFIFGSSSTGGTTSTYYYSTDGATWSTGTLPNSMEAGSPLTNGSTMVICRTFGDGATATTSAFYTTTNGTTWTTRNNPSAQTFYAGIYDGSYFIYPASSASRMSYSTDGATWSEVSYPVGFGSFKYLATNGTGKSVGLSTASTNVVKICTSNPSVPTNWVNTSATLPATGSGQEHCGIVYGNGVIIVPISGVNPTTTYYYTTNDGSSWSTGTLPVAFTRLSTTPPLDTPIRFNGSAFYFVKDNAVYQSVDGINWTTITTGTGLTATSTGHAVSADKMIMTIASTYSAGLTTILTGTP